MSLVFQQVPRSRFSWKREEQDKNQPLCKHLMLRLESHPLSSHGPEQDWGFLFKNLFGFGSSLFTQSAPVNEIFSGVFGNLEGGKRISFYKAPRKAHLGSYREKNMFMRKREGFYFSFWSRKDFCVGQPPIHFREMIEYQLTKPQIQAGETITHVQCLL